MLVRINELDINCLKFGDTIYIFGTNDNIEINKKVTNKKYIDSFTLSYKLDSIDLLNAIRELIHYSDYEFILYSRDSLEVNS